MQCLRILRIYKRFLLLRIQASETRSMNRAVDRFLMESIRFREKWKLYYYVMALRRDENYTVWGNCMRKRRAVELSSRNRPLKSPQTFNGHEWKEVTRARAIKVYNYDAILDTNEEKERHRWENVVSGRSRWSRTHDRLFVARFIGPLRGNVIIFISKYEIYV